MRDKDIADLFADGEMKVKNIWIKAYDSESGKEGWISIESVLSEIVRDLEEFTKINDLVHNKLTNNEVKDEN